MAVIFGPNPVSIKSGLQTLGPVTIQDSVTQVTTTLAHWTGQQTLSFAIDISFDLGATWKNVESVGPLGSPTGAFKGVVDLVRVVYAWKMCSCGEVYVEGYPGNSQLVVHSDHKGVPSSQIAALPDLSSITFHTPDNQPMTGLPLRQVRMQVNASGNISSVLTVSVI